MKIVLIIGAWCVGKTSTVRNIIEKQGIDFQCDKFLITKKNFYIVGDYTNAAKNFAGCDCLRTTKLISNIVNDVPAYIDTVILESLYLATTGVNVLNILFNTKFSKQLIVYLYSPIDVVKNRLLLRSGSTISHHYHRQLSRLKSLLSRYKQIGLPVICIDTSAYDINEVADIILNKVRTL